MMPVPTDTSRQDSSIHLPTVIAIAIVTYALANILHELVGHGGACVLVGGRPIEFSSMHFDGNTDGLPDWTNRVVAAGGTIVNCIAAVISLVLLRRTPVTLSLRWYFLWLFGAVNLLQGTGYLFFSGVANIGDWAAVIGGWSPALLWRIALAVVGGATYWLSVMFAFRALKPFLAIDLRLRMKRANKLAVMPYIAGGVLYVAAGLLNPLGILIFLMSAVAASFGGTSGLAWGPQNLRGEKPETFPEAPAGIPRSTGWIVAGTITAIIFVAVLGPGIKL